MVYLDGHSLTRDNLLAIARASWLCACEAIDLLAPLQSSPPLMRTHDFIRSRVPPIAHDRSVSPDLRVISDMIVSGALERSCGVDVN